MRAWIGAVALTWSLCQTGAALAADRVELPVRQVVLSDGTRRYAVLLTIVGTPVEAGIDTGSTGLRVMPSALPEQLVQGPPTRYSYGTGEQLDGPIVKVPLTIGSLSGLVGIQRIDRSSCSPGLPQCPARRSDGSDSAMLMGDGLAGEGFAAILGIDLRTDAVPNPFEALGVRRWIIELPQRGDPAPGRIILNPSDADIKNFTIYPLKADDNSIAGCVRGGPPLGRICGWATLDTGETHPFVGDTVRRRPLDTSMRVTMALGDPPWSLSASFTTDDRGGGSNLMLGQVIDSAHPVLSLGVLPYRFWSVLYDADAHTIGLKPR